jgi:hypothetical protein
MNSQGMMTISNATIFNNTSSGQNGNSGIFTAGGKITLLFCTIVHNAGPHGILLEDGLSSDTNDIPGLLVLQNTIVVATSIVIYSDPISPQAPSSSVQSQGYNLFEHPNAHFFHSSGDTIIQDPAAVFADGIPRLTNNGGPTPTIALRISSNNPAYNTIPLDACYISTTADLTAYRAIDSKYGRTETNTEKRQHGFLSVSEEAGIDPLRQRCYCNAQAMCRFKRFDLVENTTRGEQGNCSLYNIQSCEHPQK